ncbi:hypothetical protein [Falsiroseomonas sp.]|uniref:hypothetical protein n=1 Tax=Falsiroseomonas sp. TaxID=2870721 RepID=UPI003563D1FF
MPTRTAIAEDARIGAVVPEGEPALPPRISWGAVLSGAVVAVTVGAMLNVLGLAIGATSMEPAQPGASPTASLLGMLGGIWLLVANLIGLAMGGWVAARLSGTSDGTDGGLHGLSVWAVAFLLSAVLLGNAVAGTANAAFQGAASAFGGAAQSMTRGAGEAIGAAAGAVDPEALLDRLQRSLRSGGDPAALSPEQRQAEMARILGLRVRQGGFEAGQRQRLAELAAIEYGITPEEAEQRITRLEAEARDLAQQAASEARQAAAAASEVAAIGAYWIFAAMMLGAVAAVLGGRLGTRRTVAIRDV